MTVVSNVTDKSYGYWIENESVGKSETERQRQKERERKRETDRQTDSQSDRQTEKERHLLCTFSLDFLSALFPIVHA